MSSFARGSGILLHPTSLPGPHGIGTFGAPAREFIDFLAESGQRWWQMLPLGPTGYADSPYQCLSTFAGNPMLIDLGDLVERGLLTKRELQPLTGLSTASVDYAGVIHAKRPLLAKAYARFAADGDRASHAAWAHFRRQHARWLNDFALFMAMKDVRGGKAWVHWPTAWRDRRETALKTFAEKEQERVAAHQFFQFLFFTQWAALRRYARERNIRIIGDLPLYVAHDSSDAWSDRRNFLLRPDGRPRQVAGVPPDYFSRTGQLWGNPIYHWRYLERTNFDWWTRRVAAGMACFDLLRIDHFRGLAAYWAVPYGNRTAIHGAWIKAPGRRLLETLQKRLKELPIIAEDLGVITPDVEALRGDFSLPGMKILQFAFDSGESNNFLPHTYPRHCVVYTGTHDNDTFAGWYQHARPHDRAFARDYLDAEPATIAWQGIRAAWSSVACLALAPLQDLLGLDSRARMNRPGTSSGNWQWRYQRGDLTTGLAHRLRRLTKLYGR